MPVVSIKGKLVSGKNLEEIAQLLNLDFDPSPTLDPEQLLQRLDRFLRTIEEVAPKISSSVLHTKLPGRDRTVLQLLHHTVDVASSITTAEEAQEAEQTNENSATDSSVSLACLIRKIQLTLSRVQAINADWQSTTETEYGLQTKHQDLERCTWHVAQHLRQLEHFCGKWQQAIQGWPSLQDYEHLPLPESVWDD